MVIFKVEVEGVLRIIEGPRSGVVQDPVLALDERSVEVRDIPEQAADLPLLDVEQEA